jgi:uncharacterized protein
MTELMFDNVQDHETAVAARWLVIEGGRLDRRVEAINRKAIPIKARHVKRLNELLNADVAVQVKIKALWECVDELAAVIRPHAACRRGCSHCCHISVLIPQQEADLMGKRIGVKPHKVRGITCREDIESGYHNPCPFLKDDECSIYEHRPLACRQHFNVDVDPLLCELVGDTASKVPYANLRDYMEALRMFTCVREEVIRPHPQTGHPAPCTVETMPDYGDIREFFPRGKG